MKEMTLYSRYLWIRVPGLSRALVYVLLLKNDFLKKVDFRITLYYYLKEIKLEMED